MKDTPPPHSWTAQQWEDAYRLHLHQSGPVSRMEFVRLILHQHLREQRGPGSVEVLLPFDPNSWLEVDQQFLHAKDVTPRQDRKSDWAAPPKGTVRFVVVDEECTYDTPREYHTAQPLDETVQAGSTDGAVRITTRLQGFYSQGVSGDPTPSRTEQVAPSQPLHPDSDQSQSSGEPPDAD